MAENEEELKSLLLKGKEESENFGLKLTFRKLISWHLVPSLHGKQMGKQWKQYQTLFCWAPKITADGDCCHEVKRCLLLKKIYDQPRQHIKKWRHYFAMKCLSSQSYGFSSSHVWM